METSFERVRAATACGPKKLKLISERKKSLRQLCPYRSRTSQPDSDIKSRNCRRRSTFSMGAQCTRHRGAVPGTWPGERGFCVPVEGNRRSTSALRRGARNPRHPIGVRFSGVGDPVVRAKNVRVPPATLLTRLRRASGRLCYILLPQEETA